MRTTNGSASGSPKVCVQSWRPPEVRTSRGASIAPSSASTTQRSVSSVVASRRTAVPSVVATDTCP
ncbi:hypothetical protein C5D08_12455 [Rathayibacter sp. AY1B6]|nr:hypothetical protein C5D08_12455 [Rathayibacter sp. AY1B6]